jgi:protein-S-isoprenylcysteine O-methyltransferase Ste14
LRYLILALLWSPISAFASGSTLELVVWLDRFQIQPEERALLARFGAEYSHYMTQVRRWI